MEMFAVFMCYENFLGIPKIVSKFTPATALNQTLDARP
jgi:hypothetical protein